MSGPRLTDAHRKLHRLAGTWRGEDTIAVTPFNTNGGQVLTTTVARVDLAGLVVIAEDEQTRAGQVIFRAHKIFGWDGRKQVYTFHFFDSEGANPPQRAEGTWPGDRLSLRQVTPFGWVRHTFTFTNDSAFTYRMETSEDEHIWSVFWDGHYRRV
jgi:hypothetical protein